MVNTFGNTNAATASEAIITGNIRGTVFTYTGPTGGIATSITAYVHRAAASAGTYKYKHAIYLHSDLSLLRATVEAEHDPTSTVTWRELALSSTLSLTNGAAYVLCSWANNGGVTGSMLLHNDTGAAGDSHGQALTYTGTFANPMINGLGGSRLYAIYCTYTLPGGVVGRDYVCTSGFPNLSVPARFRRPKAIE